MVGIRSNFKCPHCICDAQVFSARKIEPLSRMSSQIQQRLQLWHQTVRKRIDLQQVVPDCLKSGLELSPRPMTNSNYSSPNLSIATKKSTLSPGFRPTDLDNFPEVVSEQAPPPRSRPESYISNYSAPDPSKLTATLSSRKTSAWHSWFSTKRGSTRASTPSFSFYASGKRLLLWNERGFGYYDLHDSNSIKFHKINSFNIRMAAGGHNICAIIRTIGTVRTFGFFNIFGNAKNRLGLRAVSVSGQQRRSNFAATNRRRPVCGGCFA